MFSGVAALITGRTAAVLRSWGAGINLFPGRWINGLLTWADPLADGPNTRRGQSRILFVVRSTF